MPFNISAASGKSSTFSKYLYGSTLDNHSESYLFTKFILGKLESFFSFENMSELM